MNIITEISPSITIGLNNIKLTNGHDDSLPFTCDVWAKENGRWFLIASASDDGWGGEVMVIPEPNNIGTSRRVINYLNKELPARTVTYQDTELHYDLPFLIAEMVEHYTYDHKRLYAIGEP